MTERVPHGTGHVPRGTPEFVGDSRQEMRLAAARGDVWWDLNWLGKWNTHYLQPLHHGFVDPKEKIAANTPITNMTDAEVHRLVARWHGNVYHISEMTENVSYALSIGLKVEAEPKRRQTLTAYRTLREATMGRDRWVQVKVGMWHPGKPWVWLEPAHRVFRTIALTHGMRGDDDPKKYATLPKEAEEYIDYYRGWPPHFV